MTTFHRSSQWQLFRRTWKPRYKQQIALGQVSCLHCHRVIVATEKWEIGHRLSVANALDAGWTVAQLCHESMTSPVHRLCNRRDGIAIARSRKATATRRDLRLPEG